MAESRARVAVGFGWREGVTTLALAAGFLVAASACALWIPAGRAADPLTIVALVSAYAIAARVQFEVGFASAVPTQLVFVPMLFLAPIGAVPWMVAAGFALSTLPQNLRGQWHPERISLHLVSSWYAIGPVLVLWAAMAPSASVRRLPLLAALLAAQFAFDFLGSAARGCIGLRIPVRAVGRAVGPAWLVDAALTPIGLALAVSSLAEPFAFTLGLPLLLLLGYFARDHRARIDNALELSHAYRGTALLLGDMVEADDSYTGQHSQDVVSLVLAVADRLQMSEADRRYAELTALLHDVGKVRIPKEIINKPGDLTAAERKIVNTHTIEGERMLNRVGGLLGDVGRLVRSCHERWDGGGYPDGLAGAEIPLVARVVCACDAYSAMTTRRSYGPTLSHEQAVAELRRCAGTQFDPRVVDALTAIQRPPGAVVHLAA
ncbi:MAG: HD-GYP domain-containing protein [Gaiellales bacterium]